MKNSTTSIGYSPASQPRVSMGTVAIVFAGAAALVAVTIAFVH